MNTFAETLKASLVFWHVLAFAFGAVCVAFSYRAVMERTPLQKTWKRIIRRADLHLCLSGIAIILMGMYMSGSEHYLNNPKLWAKIIVVLAWLGSVVCMRHFVSRFTKAGNMRPLLIVISVNVSCWICGAFLGCAKGLSDGAVPFWEIMAGVVVTTLICCVVTLQLYARTKNPPADTRTGG